MSGGATYEQHKSVMAERARAMSRAGRQVEIPQPRNPKQKTALERSIYRWLPHYFPDTFFNDFTSQQKAMIKAILHAARHGGDQAIAAPRGEGKTVITECVTIWCLLKGILRFPLIVAATRADAANILANIKRQFEVNERLIEQYPEVCAPIVALEGAPQRANMQLVDGERTRLIWAADRVVFPAVPKKYKSRCCGSVLMTRGLDGAIRGIRVGSVRPDLAIIDDPETRESAESEVQIERRMRTIEQDVGGLGGQKKRLARLLLCTTMNRCCVAYKYTSPADKPSWRGTRMRALQKPPDRQDLWEEYVQLRRQGMAEAALAEKSVEAAVKLANTFYADRRAEMDAGSQVANSSRYDPQTELSALQRLYNVVADFGQDAFQTEYQNDPPENTGIKESGIHPILVSKKLSGLDRTVVPPGTVKITAGIDLGKTYCHWSVIAWQSQARGSVIDYGVQEVNLSNRDDRKAVEVSLLRALFAIRETLQGTEYRTPDGEIHEIQTVLVDSGNWDRPVYEFVRATGEKQFRASKGFGETADGRRSYFRQPDKDSKQKRVGDHCFCSYQQSGQVWLFGLDSDYWKAWLHERFMTPEGQAGCLTMYGSDKRTHFVFSHHICAEIEVEEFVEGKGLKRYWKKMSQNNHWLDTTYMACVAASLHGVRVIPHTQQERANSGRRRVTSKQKVPFMDRPGGWIGGMK